MRVPFSRIVIAVLAGLALTGAVVTLLVVVNAGEGFTRCSASGAFGWTLPILAGLAIGVLVWLLHLGSRHHHEPSVSSHATARCDSCGSAMMESWRLCPYCGDLIEESPSAHTCATSLS